MGEACFKLFLMDQSAPRS